MEFIELLCDVKQIGVVISSSYTITEIKAVSATVLICFLTKWS